MLINLSNHPKVTWQKLQLETAQEIYGEIIDLPFPSISASANVEEVIELSKNFANKVIKKLTKDDEYMNAVHVMGEFTFTYNFVNEMNLHGIETVVSTSERVVKITDDGIKQSFFNFCVFRNYNSSKNCNNIKGEEID